MWNSCRESGFSIAPSCCREFTIQTLPLDESAWRSVWKVCLSAPWRSFPNFGSHSWNIWNIDLPQAFGSWLSTWAQVNARWNYFADTSQWHCKCNRSPEHKQPRCEAFQIIAIIATDGSFFSASGSEAAFHEVRFMKQCHKTGNNVHMPIHLAVLLSRVVFLQFFGRCPWAMASMLGWGDDKNQHIYLAKFDRDPLQAVKDLKADFVPCLSSSQNMFIGTKSDGQLPATWGQLKATQLAMTGFCIAFFAASEIQSKRWCTAVNRRTKWERVEGHWDPVAVLNSHTVRLDILPRSWNIGNDQLSESKCQQNVHGFPIFDICLHHRFFSEIQA